VRRCIIVSIYQGELLTILNEEYLKGLQLCLHICTELKVLVLTAETYNYFNTSVAKGYNFLNMDPPISL
jgi:hypothetical protein